MKSSYKIVFSVPHDGRTSRHIIGLFLWIWTTVYSWAAPFATTISFSQPDGTSIELWGEGDEFQAVFETLDGYTVVFDNTTKAYHYGILSGDGNELLSSGWWVGTIDPQALGLRKHLRINQVAFHENAWKRFLSWDEATKNSERWTELKAFRRSPVGLSAAASLDMPESAPPSFNTLGTKVGLCLLIDFDNDPASIPRSEIISFLNGDNYSSFGNNGSVKQYFLDNSNNKLLYSNVVTLYIRIPNSLHPKSFYNDPTKDDGTQGNLLIEDAVALMKLLPNYYSEIVPSFNALSVNNYGQILACNVFYAGNNSGVWSKGLWPHSWVLQQGPLPLTPGGKSIYRYQISNIGNRLELGVFCHENGHMLCGFPDIYDYDPSPNNSIGGAGLFCLMNSGSYGVNPVQICAYLKDAAGWATITELNNFSKASLNLSAALGNNFNHFYRYTKLGSSGTEYFLLENRLAVGRDANLPASGIAIWHIDELGKRDNQSLLTNSSHANYEVTLVQADNQWHFQKGENYGDAWDLYYSGNSSSQYINEFSSTSWPSTWWWDGTSPRIKFFEFSMPGPEMTVQFEKVLSINRVNDEVLGWGRNTVGEITFPSSLSNVVAMAAGGNHALAILKNGQVTGWGHNFSGQTTIPSGLSNVVAVAAGVEHSLALKADGQIVGWGDSLDGQISIPSGLADVVAITAGAYHSLALQSNGQVKGWGYTYNTQMAEIPPNLTNVIAISSRAYHDLALKANGEVVAWGWNEYGQTNVPSGLSNVVAIAAGYYHSLALTADGEVLGWGWDQAATVPPGLSNVVAIDAGWHHSLALKSDGEVVAWGLDLYQEAVSLTGFTNVAAIAAGYEFNLAQLASTSLTYSNCLMHSSETTSLVVPYEVGSSAFIQWYQNGIPIMGATNILLRLDDFRGYQTGEYTAISQFDFGPVLRASVNLTMQTAQVQGVCIFYNNSYWDGNNIAANVSDDAAIAPNKQALRPGQTATFSNYTSFSKGINGIMVDVLNLSGIPAAIDFTFKVGNNHTPATWNQVATAPSISVRFGAGLNGSDRITLIWPDNTIQKQWLEVTVLATATTGLSSPYVFYFGNAIGETGNSTANAVVNGIDQARVRANPRTSSSPATIDNLFDLNRDRYVNGLDEVKVRVHGTTSSTALILISPTFQTSSPP